MNRTTQKEDGWISDLVGALTDPLIVYPSPWMDSLPKWIGEELQMQRLLDLAVRHREDGVREEPMASDLEAMAYMYPASLEAPLSHDWAEIYLYVATQALKGRHPPTEIPGDIKRDSLTPDQERQLNDLKRWLYRKRIDARKGRERDARRKVRKAEEAKQRFAPVPAPKQLNMF